MGEYGPSYVRALLLVLAVAVLTWGCQEKVPATKIDARTAGDNSPILIGTDGAGVGSAPCAGNGSQQGTGSSRDTSGNPGQSSAPQPNCSTTITTPTPVIVAPPGSTTVTERPGGLITGPSLADLGVRR